MNAIELLNYENVKLDEVSNEETIKEVIHLFSTSVGDFTKLDADECEFLAAMSVEYYREGKTSLSREGLSSLLERITRRLTSIRLHINTIHEHVRELSENI